MDSKEDAKSGKKLAKAMAKAAKKGRPAGDASSGAAAEKPDAEASERSAGMAEKELALHRWKVIFAGLSVLIALISLITVLLRS